MSSKPTPPGWYPDPSQAETQRYWTGSEWTDQRAPLATKGVPFFSGVRMIALGIVCAVGVVAAVGVLWWNLSAPSEAECEIEETTREIQRYTRSLDGTTEIDPVNPRCP